MCFHLFESKFRIVDISLIYLTFQMHIVRLIVDHICGFALEKLKSYMNQILYICPISHIIRSRRSRYARLVLQARVLLCPLQYPLQLGGVWFTKLLFHKIE